MTTWRSYLISLSASALCIVVAGCGGGSTDGSASAKPAASALPMESKPMPVTDLKMDPRVVEPCFKECKAKHPDGRSDPAYMPCFDACKQRMADEINAKAK